MNCTTDKLEYKKVIVSDKVILKKLNKDGWVLLGKYPEFLLFYRIMKGV